MYVVAVTQLATSPEAEAPALGSDTGVTAYEARLLLLAGLPAIVQSTAEKAAALELLHRLRVRGHDALVCDASMVIPSSAMASMRRFRFQASDLELDDRPELLPYDDVIALVAAVHRRHVEKSSDRPDPIATMTRSIMSRWPVLVRTLTKDTDRSEDREPVLYIFRRSGAQPWILREHATNWSGLDRPIARTESENFWMTVGELRKRASLAVYDDRLVHRRMPMERTIFAGEATVRTSSDSDVDLLVHILTMWLTRNALADGHKR